MTSRATRMRFPRRQAERREEARERQERYDALTDEEKLELLESRPGNSLKEMARIKGRIEDTKKNPVKNNKRKKDRSRKKKRNKKEDES